MDNQDPLRKKIRIQGLVNIVIGLVLMITLLTLLLSVRMDLILIFSLALLNIECSIAGIFANRAAIYPSAYTASRYFRIQFAAWIVWITLGGLSLYILLVSVVLKSDNEGAKTAFMIISISVYFLIGVLFYFFTKRARIFMNDCISNYSSLEPNRVPQNAPFAAQVLYPGQSYPGNVGNPQPHPGFNGNSQFYPGPGQNYYAAQPYYGPQSNNPQPLNPPVNNPQPSEIRPFMGQAYDLSSNNSK